MSTSYCYNFILVRRHQSLNLYKNCDKFLNVQYKHRILKPYTLFTKFVYSYNKMGNNLGRKCRNCTCLTFGTLDVKLFFNNYKADKNVYIFIAVELV